LFTDAEIGFNGHITFRYKNSYWFLQVEQSKFRKRYRDGKTQVVPINGAVWNKLGATDTQLLNALNDKYVVNNLLFSGLIQMPFSQEVSQTLFDLTSKDEGLVLLFVPEILRAELSAESKAKLDELLKLFKEGKFEQARDFLKTLQVYFNKVNEETVISLDDEVDPASTLAVIPRRERLKKEQEARHLGFQVVSEDDAESSEEEFEQVDLDQYLKSKKSSTDQIYEALRSGYGMFFGDKK
jgi:hypothetical protein